MKTRNKRIAGLAAVGVLVGGGLAGAFAATSGQDDPAANLASALSQRTGDQISAADVKGAFTDVLKQRLQADVAAGRITQAQADEMLKRAQDSPLPGVGPHGGRGGHHRGPGMDAIETAVGKKIGMTEAQIDQAEAQGKTLAQIAEAKGMSRDDLVATIAATIKASERGGNLTDAQAQEIAGDIADGKGPRGGHHRGPGGPGGGVVDAAIGKALGMSAQAVDQAEHQGTTAAELAKAKGVDVDTVVSAVTDALTKQGPPPGAPALDAAQLKQMATDIVNGTGRGPGHGHGGPGGHWGP